MNDSASAVLSWAEMVMSQSTDRRELERQLEQAQRLASEITDQTTFQRIRAFIEELRERLHRRLASRRSRQEIKARAHELWEQGGRPSGRDLEFWLQAERELGDEENE
jgi:beta-phosphoglucomutase-like phosphatase (HAD superfamily)